MFVLSKIFGDCPQVKILEVFADHFDEELSIPDIIWLTDIPKTTIYSYVSKLVDENILVDCGEGTQRQLRRADISPTKITKILITHWHGDHILGLPGLIQTLAMSNYQKTLQLYGPKGTMKFSRLIEELLNRFKINIQIKEVENSVFFENRDFYIETKSMTHDSPCNAYSIILKDKIRLDKSKLKKLKLPNSPILKQLHLLQLLILC